MIVCDIRECDHCRGPRNLVPAEKWNLLCQTRIIHLCQRQRAIVEGTLQPGDEFLLRIRVGQLLATGSRCSCNTRAEEIIRVQRVYYQVPEGHLVGCGSKGVL